MTTTATALLAEHDALLASVRLSQQKHRKWLASQPDPPQDLLNLPLLPVLPQRAPAPDSAASTSTPPRLTKLQEARIARTDIPPTKRARVERYRNYVPEEETLRNDYSQRFVDAGDYPQNWVLGAEPERRFEEYPKQQRLLELKKVAVNSTALPPFWAPISSLAQGEMSPAKFDVILLDPPYSSSFTFDTLSQLPIPSLAADPSFVFLWVGSGAGEALERGREVLAKWGYRRCEDIVWVKTNRTTNRGPGSGAPTSSLLTRTKQHCLMGIRGTVRRSTDGWFVHCNVDTDVIVWEGDPTDPTRKPPEMYTLIENFCLGLRRLEVFGRSHSLRRGWVTAGEPTELVGVADKMGAREWQREAWEAELAPRKTPNGKFVVPMTGEIDALRPKSPVRNNPPNHQHHHQQQQQMQGGMGMGGGMVNPMMNMNMGMGMPMGGPMNPMGMMGPGPGQMVGMSMGMGGGMGGMGGGGPGGMGGHGGMGSMGGMSGPGGMGGMANSGGMGSLGNPVGMGNMGNAGPMGNVGGGPTMNPPLRFDAASGGLNVALPQNMGPVGMSMGMGHGTGPRAMGGPGPGMNPMMMGGMGGPMMGGGPMGMNMGMGFGDWDPSQQGMGGMGMNNMNMGGGGEWY